MVEKKPKSFSSGIFDSSGISFLLVIDHLLDDRDYGETVYPMKVDAKLCHKNFVLIHHEENYVVTGWRDLKEILLTTFGNRRDYTSFDIISEDTVKTIINDFFDAPNVINTFDMHLDIEVNIH